MKVVINTCFGGFGVSAEALKRLIELDSACVQTLTSEQWSGSKKSVGKSLDAGDGYHSIVPHSDVLTKEGLVYLLHYDCHRDDPHLVQVVEELGDAANGPFARLAVIEIPDGINYTIENYDGQEHVAEVHRTWG